MATMVADLKVFLELSTGDAAIFDPLLVMILDAEKVKADSYLGIKYFDVVVGTTKKFDGFRKIFALGHANVSSVSVVITAGDDQELVDDTVYVVDTVRGILKVRSGELQAGKDAIEITFNGGYAEDNIPKDMRFAVIKQASYEFRRRKDVGLVAVSFPDGSVSKFDTGEFLPDVMQILNKYRRIYL